MKTNMSLLEFDDWRRSWFGRIPKCRYFCCVHENSSCAIDMLCGCGSIYETYKTQKLPIECTSVTCKDCLDKHDCDRYKKENDK